MKFKSSPQADLLHCMVKRTVYGYDLEKTRMRTVWPRWIFGLFVRKAGIIGLGRARRLVWHIPRYFDYEDTDLETVLTYEVLVRKREMLVYKLLLSEARNIPLHS